MPGGGFWGTAREEEWHRRKDREYAREQQIRNQETANRQALIEQHDDEMQAKDHVLNLTKRMLVVCRRQSPAKVTGSSIEEEEHVQTVVKCEHVKDDDAKMPANKKPRVAINQESEVPHSNQEAGEPLQVQVPDTATSSSTSDPTVSVAIQENLLALSYAMFDTLYETNSFQPKPFCEYLIGVGQRIMAEQIALAAVEKSRGRASDVRYVLFELVPNSADPNVLVNQVTTELEKRSNPSDMRSTGRDEGKQVLAEWHALRGNTDAAFQAASTVHDEKDRLQKCIPLLEGKAERKEQLRKACRRFCNERVIGVFSDEEWPDFLMSIDLPAVGDFCYHWQPDIMDYLDYAANQLSHQAGKLVAEKVLEELVRTKFPKRSSTLPGPSRVRQDSDVRASIIESRRDGYKIDMRSLSDIGKEIHSNSRVTALLKTLAVDPNEILVKILSQAIEGFANNDCPINHRDLIVTYKCSRCRDAMGDGTELLALLLALRQHELTKTDPRFLALGLLGTNPATALQRRGFSQHAVDALLSDMTADKLMRQVAMPNAATSK